MLYFTHSTKIQYANISPEECRELYAIYNNYHYINYPFQHNIHCIVPIIRWWMGATPGVCDAVVASRTCSADVSRDSRYWLRGRGKWPSTGCSSMALWYLLTKHTQIIDDPYKQYNHVIVTAPRLQCVRIGSAQMGELRVDLLNVSSGILSDNEARYHRPIGLTALLESICFWWTHVSYNWHLLFNKSII